MNEINDGACIMQRGKQREQRNIFWFENVMRNHWRKLCHIWKSGIEMSLLERSCEGEKCIKHINVK
jgi:hypothetical protein